MSMTAAFLQEFDKEAGTTRRVLERVPADRLGWKPHPKSMSLGQLALHVAGSPGHTAAWAENDVFEMNGPMAEEPQASSTAEILAAHDASVTRAKQVLHQLG